MHFRTVLPVLILTLLILFSCKNESKEPDTPPKPKVTVNVPDFSADSAYNYIAKQVEFGPRVPNSEAHKKAAAWLATELETNGAKVITQNAKVKMYSGKVLNAKNIIASYNPQSKQRVLLCAHWDSRHIADAAKTDRDKPILGADDGGSGVGVLLEIARTINTNQLKDIGVDIILFDAEDQGQPSDGGGFPEMKDSWCLGAQYWARNPHKGGYRANFGILLDMVGSKGARFTMDGTSRNFAADIMKKVWNMAHDNGYGSYFDFAQTDQIIDDHLYVNIINKTPTIDIINRPRVTETGFGKYWHTHDDNMEVIDRKTLKAVGQTVLNVLYHYDEGQF